ncbi:MAG: hypothetical protein WCJ64_13755 [Rhodospirillaceae bacterium]
MRRLVVYLMVGLLALATAVPPRLASAQEPWQEPPPQRIETRDITPYMVGLGAIMGMIAFNIAAPPVSAWFGSALTATSNFRTALWATRQAVATGAPVVVASARPAAAAASGSAAASAVRAAGPVVPPLTGTLMAQTQILATAAATAGALVVHYVYRLVNWATGAAP